MSVKFIACDLDGTLLGADHITVGERTKTALLKAHEKGIKIAIATGRTLPVIYGTVDQIPFADYVIYSNGAAVCDLKSAKTVYSNYMPADVAVKVIEFLLKYPVYFEVYSDAKQYSQAGREKYFNDTAYEILFSDWSSDVCSSDLGLTYPELLTVKPFWRL